MKQSPRQELGNFAGRGDFRQILEHHPQGLSPQAIDLAVRIVLNYCEPRRKKRKQ